MAPSSYSSAAGLSRATQGLFYAVVVSSFLLGGAAMSRGSKFEDFLNNRASIDDLDKSDNLVGGLGLLVAAVSIAFAVLLAIWSHRSAKNATALSRPIETSPGLAAGGWFIPFANFFLSYKMLSQQQTRSQTPANQRSFLIGWWACWIISGLVSFLGRRSLNFENIDRLSDISDRAKMQGTMLILSAVLTLGAAFLASKVIGGITKRHEELAASWTPPNEAAPWQGGVSATGAGGTEEARPW